MDAALTGPPAMLDPPSRIKSKLPKAKVKQMAQSGLSTYQIAKVVGVNQSTIHRFLEKIKPESQAVSLFRGNRAEVLATLQAKNLTIQEQLLERLGEERLLASLTPAQISGLMFALNTQHGTLYDKERLETGQSTQNHSLVAKILSSAVNDIYNPLIDKQSVATAPHQGAGSDESADGSTTYSSTEQEQEPCHDSVGGGPGGTGGNIESGNDIDS